METESSPLAWKFVNVTTTIILSRKKKRKKIEGKKETKRDFAFNVEKYFNPKLNQDNLPGESPGKATSKARFTRKNIKMFRRIDS